MLVSTPRVISLRTNTDQTKTGRVSSERYLKHDHTLPLVSLPDPLEVVDAIAPLVHQ